MSNGMDETQEQLSALLNGMLSDHDPGNRILFARRMALGFGRLFMLNRAGLEQVVTQLQADATRAERESEQAKLVPHELVQMAAKLVRFDCIILGVFLKYRESMIRDIHEKAPDKSFPDPIEPPKYDYVVADNAEPPFVALTLDGNNIVTLPMSPENEDLITQLADKLRS